jgi:hypothetical protein
MSNTWLEGSAGDGVMVDDTYFPVVVSTWFGAATEPAVRAYFAWLHRVLGRAQAGRVPALVNITDAGPAGNPSPDVRRLIAELTVGWEKAGADQLHVTSYVVVESAVIRGVLTALGWLHGDMKAENLASCSQAIERALADLAAAGVSPPVGLDPARWRRPGRGARAAS